jgi:hypothetical protein
MSVNLLAELSASLFGLIAGIWGLGVLILVSCYVWTVKCLSYAEKVISFHDRRDELMREVYLSARAVLVGNSPGVQSINTILPYEMLIQQVRMAKEVDTAKKELLSNMRACVDALQAFEANETVPRLKHGWMHHLVPYRVADATDGQMLSDLLTAYNQNRSLNPGIPSDHLRAQQEKESR